MDRELKELWSPKDVESIERKFQTLNTFKTPLYRARSKRRVAWFPLAVTASVLLVIAFVPQVLVREESTIPISLSSDELEELYLPIVENPLYLGVLDE